MRSDRQAGLVLVSIVLLLALLGLVTGGSLWVTRADLWAAGRARSELQATYTAEAGVRHGLAVLAPDVDWAAVVERSPAALSSPDEAGPWPIGDGGWVAFPGPPFGYGLGIVGPIDHLDRSGRLVVRSAATAVRGAAAVAIASLARAATPYAPAAVVLAGGSFEVEAAAFGTLANPRVEIFGADGAAALGAASSEGLAAAVAAATAAGARLEGDRSAAVRRFEIGRFGRRSGLDEVAPERLAVPLGAPGSPAAVRVWAGSAPSLRGVGIVLVSGDLDIVGEVGFSGVLVVDGRVQLGGAACRIDGMVWATDVSLAGPCRIAFDRDAVLDADRALRLPRLPVLTALTG